MPLSSRDELPPNRNWVLRRADQLTVGGLTLLAIVALAGYWASHGGFRGRLIDVDRAPLQSAAFLVDINHADWPELAELPGVGESLAKRIVEVRQTHGPFADHAELRRVRGIGPRTLDKMRPYLLPMAESGAVAGR